MSSQSIMPVVGRAHAFRARQWLLMPLSGDDKAVTRPTRALCHALSYIIPTLCVTAIKPCRVDKR